MTCDHEQLWQWGQWHMGELLVQKWCTRCGAIHDGETWALPARRDGSALEISGEWYGADTVKKAALLFALIAFVAGSFVGFVAGFYSGS